jgi:DNA-binding response OmpR family regulator
MVGGMGDRREPGGGASGAGKVEVLVVDDSEDLADAMALMLSDAGYETRVARNGRAALAAVSERRPALILTDGLMPEMNGLELLTALRSDLAPPIPPVIVISGFPAIEKEALRRGAADFLHKPVSPGELVATARRVLARRARPSDVSERTKQRALEARREVSLAAEAVLARHDPARDKLRAAAARLSRWLVGYYGFGTVIVVGIRPDEILPLAEARWPGAGVVAPAAANHFMRDIAETRSSLLLRDTERYAPEFVAMAQGGAIRFFAGVPFVAADGLPVGAVAMLDVEPHHFPAGDLRLLEYLGRAGSERIEDVLENRPRRLDPFVDDRGILDGRAFKELLAIELDLAAGSGESVALAIAEVSGPAGAQVATWTPPEERVRLGIGWLSSERIGYFKRAPALDHAVDVLETALGANGVGVGGPPAALLTLEPQAVPLLDAHTALDLVESSVCEARHRARTLRLSLSVGDVHPRER